MTKDEYILNSLSKIKHKNWELYVVSRIVHGLCDAEIEFVCQQLIRRPDGKRALVDMYFPQFGVFLEVDEPQHATLEHKENDRRRTEDIINAADLTEYRIKVYSGEGEDPKALDLVAGETDSFIELIRRKKTEAIKADRFLPWDFEARYRPEPHLERGYISLSNNPVFKFQRDALRCFGYTKGHFQRGAWTLATDPSRAVWFPRLYETDVWDNDLSPDGKKITEKKKAKDGGNEIISDANEWSSRIVFARYQDKLGSVMYRFVGEFSFTPNDSDDYVRIYRLKSESVKTMSPRKQK